MNSKQYIINDAGKAMSPLVEKNCTDIDKYLSPETIDMRQLAIDFIDCIKDTFDGRYLIDDEHKFYGSLKIEIKHELDKRFS